MVDDVEDGTMSENQTAQQITAEAYARPIATATTTPRPIPAARIPNSLAYAPGATELRPPAEHADKLAHWLLFEGRASVHGWMSANPTPGWTSLTGGFIDANTKAAIGYRYLGPAEWRTETQCLGDAVDLVNAAGCEVVSKEWRRQTEAEQTELAHFHRAVWERDKAVARIRELEAENATLRADPNRWLVPLLARHLDILRNRGLLPPEAERALIYGIDLAAGPDQTAAVERQPDGTCRVLSERGVDEMIRAPVTAASTLPGDEVFPLDMDPKPTHFSGIGAAATVSAPAATKDRATDPVGPNDETHQQVERVIGDLVNNRVVQPARKALREALDKADAPPRGRAAADAGLGRAIARLPR